MTNTEEKILLARRIASALRHYGGFVYEDDLDKHSTVIEVIREAGANLALSIALLDPRKRIYALIPVDKRCKVSCNSSCENDPKCTSECMDKCRSEIAAKIAEMLERYAQRAAKH